MSGIRIERAGSLPAPSHRPRGSCPPLLASGPPAQGCLFIHFPRRPSCLTVRAHNGALCSGAPTPIPKGQRAQGRGGSQPPSPLTLRSGGGRGGKSGQSFSKTSWRQGQGGLPKWSCQALLLWTQLQTTPSLQKPTLPPGRAVPRNPPDLP